MPDPDPGTAEDIIEAMESGGFRFENSKHRQTWLDYLNEPIDEDTFPSEKPST